MAELSQVIESFEASKDYYIFIKETFINYSKYIKQYHSTISNFIKKLGQIQEKFSQNLVDFTSIKNKYKNSNINPLFDIFSIFPKVVQKIMESYSLSLADIEPIIQNFEKSLNIMINIDKKEEEEKYESLKNNLTKYYKNLDKNNTIFMNKMSTLEDLAYNYYNNKYGKNILSNEKKNDKDKEKDNKADNVVTKDQVNLCIVEAIKSQNQYLSSFDANYVNEKEFNNYLQKSKLNFYKISLDLTLQLKRIILDMTTIVKSNLINPVNDIDNLFTKYNEFEKKIKLEKLIEDFFSLKKQLKIKQPKKFKLKILSEPKNIKNKYNPHSHIITLEDGFNELSFLDNFDSIYTVEKICKNIQLVEKDDKLNFDQEKKITKFRELSKKLLTYGDKGKEGIKEKDNIYLNEEEIISLKNLLNEHIYRVVFLQDLNTFRAKGLYCMPKDIYDFMCDIFSMMLDTVERDKDYHTAKNVIILSLTYYYLSHGDKRYIQEVIMDNKIFQSYNFWEGYTQFTIEKEIIKSIQTNTKNGTLIKQTQKESDDMYGSIVFGQLVSISDNMISFGYDLKNIKSIIKPIIKHYNISEESINIIDDIIHKNSLKKSILLNDEIKEVDLYEIYNNYKNFDTINNEKDDEIKNDENNKKSSEEDSNYQDEEKDK